MGFSRRGYDRDAGNCSTSADNRANRREQAQLGRHVRVTALFPRQTCRTLTEYETSYALRASRSKSASDDAMRRK